MATSAFTVDRTAITGELQRQSRLRTPGKPDGGMVFKVNKSFVGADFDVAGDLIQICKFPDRFRLLGFSLKSDSEYDTGGTAARLDVVLEDGVGTAFTSAVGAAFTLAGQPQNDGVEIISDAAGDTTQTIEIIGTVTGTDTLTTEIMNLNGTSVVASSRTDWGFIVAARVLTGTLTAASTVTLRETSGNVAFTTLTPTITSRGVNTVSPTAYYNRKINFTASGSSVKTIGFKGTDEDGNTIYDSQVLTGATQEQSNSSFVTVTELYTGDVESSRTVTIVPSEQLLVAASSAFNQTPILPINYNGATISGSEYGMDASEGVLSLRVAIAPTTGQAASMTVTATVHGYISANPLKVLS